MFDRLLLLTAIPLVTFSLIVCSPTGNLSADEPAAIQAPVIQAPGDQPAAGESTPERAAAGKTAPETEAPRVQRIATYLSGAKFTGQFTVDGKPNAKPESYTISSCEPLDQPDMYRLKVKIRYGDVDGEFPMDLKILWAGSTPVITLDAIWIPGLGTFSSRVLIHQNRYAGTWQHDEKGGQLFGTIEKSKDE